MIVVAMLVVCVDPLDAGPVMGTSPGDVIGIFPGESIGMSPAKTETEKTHVNAIAIRRRFINFFSFGFEPCKNSDYETE
jgi:hypothetical protein